MKPHLPVALLSYLLALIAAAAGFGVYVVEHPDAVQNEWNPLQAEEATAYRFIGAGDSASGNFATADRPAEHSYDSGFHPVAGNPGNQLVYTAMPREASATALFATGGSLRGLEASSRYSDTGKGCYFSSGYHYYRPYRGAEALYAQNGNWDFMGSNLAPAINSGATSVSGALSGLTHDVNMCWANATANVLQYWQSYYGVFYDGCKGALPYGWNYDPSLAESLGGSQSLAIYNEFYKNWYDEGGTFKWASDWYCRNVDPSKTYIKNEGTGGWWENWFGENHAYAITYFNGNSSHATLTNTFAASLGYSRREDGSWVQTTMGQIAYLGINSAIGGHAITCWGMDFDEAGMVHSIYIANSDDLAYGTVQLYLKSEGGQYYLFNDKDCTEYWNWNATYWYLDEVSYVNTPQALKDLYSAYSSSDLVWTGAADEWSERFSADRQIGYALPDASSGWTAEVNGTAYHSYYEAGRNLVFGDSATTDIATSGSLRAGHVELANTAKDYVFTDPDAATALDAVSLHAATAGSARFNGMQLSFSDALELDGYSLSVAHGSLSAGTATLLGGASLTLEDSVAHFMDLLLGDHTVLTLDFSRAGDEQALVSVSGTLTIAGALTLNVGGLPTDLAEIYMVFSAGEFDTASWGDNITLNGTSREMLFWRDNVLYYGNAVDKQHQYFTEHTEAPERWRKFEGLSFSAVTYDKDGAALCNLGSLSFDKNGPVEFIGNSTTANGGAIANAGTLQMEGNKSVLFRGNSGSAGGAVSHTGSSFSISGSQSVSFEENRAARGGALYQNGGSMSIFGNESVSFRNNRATESGGAALLSGGTLELADNTSLSFTGNSTDGRGGAIAVSGGQLIIRGNGDTQFTSNHAGTAGGAISGTNNGRVTLFADAGDITFRGNTQGSGSNTILRAIDSQGDIHTDTLVNHFSAAEGQRITFYDSVRVENSAWYGQTNLNTQGSGTIEFSGKYAAQDLQTATGTAPAAEALAASRSSVFTGSLYLAGGTLRLADDASLSASSLYMADGAVAVTIAMENGSLSTPNSSLTFGTNKELELTGINTIATSYFALFDESLITFNLSEVNAESAALTLISPDRYEMQGHIILTLNGTETLAGGRYKLIEASGGYSVSCSLTMNGGAADALSWEDGVLWYDADYTNTPPAPVNLVFTETQSGSFSYEGNNSLSFSAGSFRAIDETGIDASEVSLTANGSIIFESNRAEGDGGAIGNASASHAAPGVITIADNGRLAWSLNTASGDGGAIANLAPAGGDAYVLISGNGRDINTGGVFFTENRAEGNGGAIANSGTLELTANGELFIGSNSAGGDGGAICNSGVMRVTENAGLTLANNRAEGRGGAIANSGTLQLNGNQFIVATGNVSLYGAAVYNTGSLSMENNGYIQFAGNDSVLNDASGSSFGPGGNICNTAGAEISIRRNGDVSLSSTYAMYGGSIYNEGTVTITDNRNVNLDSNTAEGNGGAVMNFGTFILSNNEQVTFNEDWAWGGYGSAVCNMQGRTDICDNAGLAVYSSYTAFSNGNTSGRGDAVMNICGNGDIIFYDNIAYRSEKEFNGMASAILNLSNGTLNICGNGNVEFSDNTILTFAEISPTGKDMSYLHALHNEGTLNLSATEGKSITFYDSISSAEGSVVNLNADYTDSNGSTHRATGDIVFSGAKAEALLYANLKAEYVTAETIRLSKTSDIDTQVTLYNGTLRVEDGAVLRARSLTAEAGSGIILQQGTLAVEEWEMQAGATLSIGADSGTLTLLSADGKTSAKGDAMQFSESGIDGQGGTLINTLIDLKEGVCFELSDVVLAAGSRITDDPARLLLHEVTVQAAMGVNAEQSGDSVLCNTTLTLSGSPLHTTDTGAPVTVTNITLSSFDTVTLCGDSLLISLSGLGDAEAHRNAYLALTFSSGADNATFDRDLCVSLTLSATGETLQGWYRGDEVAPSVVYFDMSRTPEPATTTLSLLALAALCARRKRH